MQNFTDRGFQSSLFADQWGAKTTCFGDGLLYLVIFQLTVLKLSEELTIHPFLFKALCQGTGGSPSYASFLDVDTTGNGVYTRIATAPPGQMTSPLLPLGLSVYGLSIFEQSPSYGMRIFWC